VPESSSDSSLARLSSLFKRSQPASARCESAETLVNDKKKTVIEIKDDVVEKMSTEPELLIVEPTDDERIYKLN